MKAILGVFVLVALYCATEATNLRTPPKVQVYTREPGEHGKTNTLICHVSGFHPPDITIELVKDAQELANSQQTDLAFNQDWHFHLTRSVGFTPNNGEKYICRVTHGSHISNVVWDPNM